jgi:hypothetical protein
MNTIVRNILAILAGLIIGSIVNMGIVILGSAVLPLPEGVDTSDMEKLREGMKLFTPAHFIAPFLAHALGTLVGAFVTAKLAAGPRLGVAMVIGELFLLGGISMVAMIGGPLWFIVMDLVLAYLPMAYLGAWLAGATATRAA